MRVAILNENVFSGGTESQVFAEIELLESSAIEVWHITYDPDYKQAPVSQRHINVPPETLSGISKWKRQLGGDPSFFSELRSTLASINPDVIHLNNVFSRPHDVYKAVMPYPVVQTLRDYSAICPRDFCTGDAWAECGGYRNKTCICSPELKTIFQHKKLAMVNKFRTEAVDCFVAPSVRLCEKCKENGINVEPLGDMLSPSRMFKNNIKFNGSFLYYGRISEEKGVGRLLEAFADFSHKKKDARLILAGAIDESFRGIFSQYEHYGWFDYRGFLDLEALKSLYSEVSYVVVPSLWMENYPNTALEAMANNTLVIGSNRGGIPEMIENENLLFDVLSQESIKNALFYASGLSRDSYEEIVLERSNKIRAISSPDEYFNRIYALFEYAICKAGKG